VSAGSTITSAGESQEAVKDWIVGLVFADVSDVKDHGYFFSMYARTRGGALFELPYSTPQGFFIDEAENARGTHKGIPPRWERGRAEIAQLEPIGTVDPVAGATAAPTRRGGD